MALFLGRLVVHLELNAAHIIASRSVQPEPRVRSVLCSF